MDFHSLMRRDLQFLCKKNKIPANMTNVAMADALKALEIVEGLEEYMNQFEQSATSVAKQPSKTATRTTRRTTIRKAEAQPSSRSVSLSTNKSLADELDEENITNTVTQEPKTNSVKFEANVPKTPAARSTRKGSVASSCNKKEEMDLENIKKTVAQEPKTNSVKFEANVPKTPAARSTRKGSVASSCNKKEEIDQENINKTVAQEPKTNSLKFEANVPKTPAARSTRKASAAAFCAKKDELVQSVYSTRRSTRLLEKCMADLSLKTSETLDNAEKNEDTEPQKKNPAGSETEVIPGRNLSDSMEQWENLKNDSDMIVEDLEVNVDIAVVDTNTVINKDVMNEVLADEKEPEDSLVHKVDDQEETMADQTDSEAGDSETKQAIQQIDSEREKSSNIVEDNLTGNDADIAVMDTNTERNMEEMIEVKANEEESENSLVHKVDDLEETKADQTDSDAGDSETKQGIQQNDSERIIEEINEVMDDEEESENCVVQVDPQEETLHANHEEVPKKNQNDDSPLLENENTESHKDLALDSLIQVEEQETEQANKEDDSELDFVVETMVDQTDSDYGDKTESEEDNYGNDSDDTISDTDSNQADQIVEDLEVHVDVIALLDANTERNKEEMDEVTADEKEFENSLAQEEAFNAEKIYNGDSSVQGNEQANKEDDSELVRSNAEETMVNRTYNDATDSETEQAIQQNESEPEKTSNIDDAGDNDSDDTISEADSIQAVLGSDIADEEMTLSESGGYTATTDAPKSPPHLKVAKDIKTTDEEITLSESEGSTATTNAPKSPPSLEVAKDIKTTDEEITLSESEGSTATNDAPKSPPHLEVANDIKTASAISFQFPRPTKTTPLKNSSVIKVVNENKENNMEMMMMNENGGKEGKTMKKKKVTMIDEENLKDLSMRQLEKMVKELSIKSNRTALKILPGTNNNQTAE